MTEAFLKGFIKAAMDEGLTYGQALDLSKQAMDPALLNDYVKSLSAAAGGQALTSAIGGGGAGALGGGVLGYLGGRNKANPADDHRYRDAILGAGMGGLGGGLIGGAMSAHGSISAAQAALAKEFQDNVNAEQHPIKNFFGK